MCGNARKSEVTTENSLSSCLPREKDPFNSRPKGARKENLGESQVGGVLDRSNDLMSKSSSSLRSSQGGSQGTPSPLPIIVFSP